MKESYQIFDAAGKVLTAAEHNTQLASDSIKAMNNAVAKWQRGTEELGRQIQQEIKTSLGWAAWKVFYISVTIGIVIIIGIVLLLKQTIPTYSEITALRAEKQQLEADIAVLEKRGARIQLNDCLDKQRKRLCVKIDEKAPQYTNGFRVLAGY
jgi:hypothetical protein